MLENKNNPLVSIIIPVFNRVTLLAETLDSIRAQTYQNWECIIVDDASTDGTHGVINEYCELDSRFVFFQRPENKPAGGNAARNYGFIKSKGAFVNWFDSDDLMTPKNLETKLANFNDEIDFVISNSINFDVNGNKSRQYKLNYEIPINAENFIVQKISWMTIDVMFRRKVITIKFNETLSSGQEYNFFSRFLYESNRGLYVKEDLAYRRLHDESIQQQLLKDRKKVKQRTLAIDESLLEDLKDVASPKIINRSLTRIVRVTYELSTPFKTGILERRTYTLLKQHQKNKAARQFKRWMLSNRFTGKGYVFIKKTTSLLL